MCKVKLLAAFSWIYLNAPSPEFNNIVVRLIERRRYLDDAVARVNARLATNTPHISFITFNMLYNALQSCLRIHNELILRFGAELMQANQEVNQVEIDNLHQAMADFESVNAQLAHANELANNARAIMNTV